MSWYSFSIYSIFGGINCVIFGKEKSKIDCVFLQIVCNFVRSHQIRSKLKDEKNSNRTAVKLTERHGRCVGEYIYRYTATDWQLTHSRGEYSLLNLFYRMYWCAHESTFLALLLLMREFNREWNKWIHLNAKLSTWIDMLLSLRTLFSRMFDSLLYLSCVTMIYGCWTCWFENNIFRLNYRDTF